MEAKSHLQKIDFLRGVAIILVFTFHAHLALFGDNMAVGYKPNGVINISGARNLVLNFSPSAFGWSGVSLFFVISGFLIHLGYLKNERSFNTVTFYSKRFWRIYPPYWLILIIFSLTVSFFASAASARVSLYDFALHFVTLHNLSDKTFYSINPSFWSLAAEAQLYLIYPLFLTIRKKMGINAAFLLIVALSVVLLVYGILFNNFGTAYTYGKNVFELWFVWAAGAYYAERYVKGKKITDKAGLLFLVTFLLLIASGYYRVTSYFQFHISTLAWVLLFDWILNAGKVDMNTIFSKCVIVVGLCSYSMYLIHQPYLRTMIDFFGRFTGGTPFRMAAVIPAFLIVFALSYLLYRFIELPSISIGKHLRREKK